MFQDVKSSSSNPISDNSPLTDEVETLCKNILLEKSLENKSNKVYSRTLSDEFKQTTCDEETKDIYIVPLSFQSDIFGRAGAWRVWSSIWIARLIHNAMQSIPMMTGTLIPV